MVAFCGVFGEADAAGSVVEEASAGVVPVRSGPLVSGSAGGSNVAGAPSGVDVRPRRGVRPCTAEELLSRAITRAVELVSSGGVECEESVDEIGFSGAREVGAGAEV